VNSQGFRAADRREQPPARSHESPHGSHLTNTPVIPIATAGNKVNRFDDRACQVLPHQANGRTPSEDTPEFAFSIGSSDRMLADCHSPVEASLSRSCALLQHRAQQAQITNRLYSSLDENRGAGHRLRGSKWSWHRPGDSEIAGGRIELEPNCAVPGVEADFKPRYRRY